MTKKEKRELIISCIIGDGHLSNENHLCKNYPRMIIGHGEQQLDYLLWKTNLLNSTDLFASKVSPSRWINKKGDKSFIQYRCNWSNCKLLRIYRKWMYRGNKKTIRQILKYLSSPLSLAIWFMDDGSVFKRKRKHKDGSLYFLKPSLKLCTHNFNYSDNNLILQWMKITFGIEGYIVVERKKSIVGQPEYFTLNFNSNNTLKIWNLIQEYTQQIPSMQKKFEFVNSYYRLSEAPTKMGEDIV